ncbi:hypothetical protein PtA15_9A230 [Puccinia triticina]|uniref:Uncharacterized protein n=1 Tax=Puccinia triticina TaxID=208348 RepID=A0ABY7CSX9_9BASI|nr:uncharacterized protein PtA15_9A230 [Puccinia triticina]WAQ88105.1 hypothetical protein PtA15_9A230 [Puccinia triticina]
MCPWSNSTTYHPSTSSLSAIKRYNKVITFRGIGPHCKAAGGHAAAPPVSNYSMQDEGGMGETQLYAGVLARKLDQPNNLHPGGLNRRRRRTKTGDNGWQKRITILEQQEHQAGDKETEWLVLVPDPDPARLPDLCPLWLAPHTFKSTQSTTTLASTLR